MDKFKREIKRLCESCRGHWALCDNIIVSTFVPTKARNLSAADNSYNSLEPIISLIKQISLNTI